MRGGSRRRNGATVATSRDFAWGRPLLATLRHSSLPFDENLAGAVQLHEVKSGGRDRLSLLGQFAAHQALLQFAGIADGELDPAEWSVVQKRGSDVRLVRVAARACDAAIAPPVLTIAQQFAELVGAELDVLEQSWARAEAVYVECFARLRGDVAADLRWLRRAAHGAIASPGPDALPALIADGDHGYDDADCVATIARFDESAVVLRGASPLERYSALASLGRFEGNEASVAEKLVAMQKPLFVVADLDRFDEGSRRVIEILRGIGGATWIVPGAPHPLPETRHFVVAPRLAVRRALDERLVSVANRGEWLERFVDSPAFAAYLEHGDLPEDDCALPALAEPARSYVGALALLGSRIQRELAERFLGDFLFGGDLETLAVPGISVVIENEYLFEGEPQRAKAAKLIPLASRAALCRVAASLTGGVQSALLWLDAGDGAKAAEVLERVEWASAEEIVETLHRLPRAVLTSRLARTYGDALIDCGRYRDARDVATLLEEDAKELLLARAERRTGDYAPALARLERMATRTFAAELLRGELLRLTQRDVEAEVAFANCRATTHEEATRLTYERSLIDCSTAIALDDPYLTERSAVYAADDPDTASHHAFRSLQCARTTCERIDAWLDCLFAEFSAGRWQEARHVAIEALHAVEETQGDRAAGGILFFLAYLAADDAQWAHASQRIARLRHYYSGTSDDHRLRELHLLSAHLDFCRGRFADARRAAAALLDAHPEHDQIHEAAALILDEVDCIEHRPPRMRSTGESGNRELSARREAIRNGLPPGDPDDPSPTARLKLFRAALAHGQRELAQRIASELDLVLDAAPPADAELRILRTAAAREFPFAAHDFDLPWCFATRNRLGLWSLVGSHVATEDELESPANDWIRCSDRELLWFDGGGSWSSEGRDAVAAVFRIKSENVRLRRLLEQEEHSRPPQRSEAIEGLAGDSAPIREVLALITRVAKRDVPVCVLGESGTGKELVARAIHRNSSRRQKTFTALNCAALPENLIESELFGHVRGAFTGADRDRQGLIESTDGGTLFLDEIGEMPLGAQAKLLRFLQEGELRRVGDVVNRTADVRIVSATNRKLENAVEEGRFREDLYYRIRGVEITLPPLRERVSDIPLLGRHFLAQEHEKHRGGATSFAPEVEAIFASYSWPGNVRELQNTIRAAHAMAADAKQIALEHLPARLRSVAPARVAIGSYQEAVSRFRRELIEKSLVQARGNQNQAAAMLQISRQALAYQIRELGIMVNKP